MEVPIPRSRNRNHTRRCHLPHRLDDRRITTAGWAGGVSVPGARSAWGPLPAGRDAGGRGDRGVGGASLVQRDRGVGCRLGYGVAGRARAGEGADGVDAALDRQLACSPGPGPAACGVGGWSRSTARRSVARAPRGSAAPHLVAALDHDSGVVLDQLAVAAKSNEIPAVRDLLAGYPAADLRACVITVDAMHTQTDTAEAILAA
jgi:hypothetical protein